MIKKQDLIEKLNDEYPIEVAILEDYIGEQVEIPEIINKIMVTLDVTIDVISQAIDNKVELIISHHPMFFGNKEELLISNQILKSKYELLLKSNIGLYVIHTNADFNPNSIAFNQAMIFDEKKVYQNNENKSVTLELEQRINIIEIIDTIKNELSLNDVEFRTNALSNENFEKIIFASGASGNQINYLNSDSLYIIGEIKHHEWVNANELNIKILEISHFSEKIFKEMIQITLDDIDIDLIKSKEKNGYKII